MPLTTSFLIVAFFAMPNSAAGLPAVSVTFRPEMVFSLPSKMPENGLLSYEVT